jgi:sortase A
MVRAQKNMGRVLILMGALLFSLYGYLMFCEFWVQRMSARMLEQSISGRDPENVMQLQRGVTQLRPGEIIGRLEIPRIEVSVIVLEGTDSSVLDVAAGHIPGTAVPGVRGNIVVAAHRDTFFRALRTIQPRDRVSFRTPDALFEYSVESTEVVDPTNIEVLHQTTDSELTLVTCYPFTYIGQAPKRFIVHARPLT